MKTPRISKTLKIPPDLYEKILALHRETGLNEHALILQLLTEGIESRRLGNARQQAKHLASELDDLLKRRR